MFRDEESAIEWLEEIFWPNGPFCKDCGSFNVQSGIKHKTMTHRCRDCPSRPMFSLRKGTVMEGTKLPYRTWAIGVYLFKTNIKGISSMRLHRELGITQKAAWFMLHRLRKAAEMNTGYFKGPVEVDETPKRGYVGVYHKMSPKHLNRHVREFEARHNLRDEDTLDQMARLGEGMAGKRLRYQDLIADNGLSSGARSG